MLLQQRLNTRRLRTHQRILGDHQGLVPVADVIREPRPLRGVTRRDEEHRLVLLDDRDDDPLGLENEPIAVAEHRPARERCTELDTAIRQAPSVHMRARLPAERHDVTREGARVWRQLRLSVNTIHNNHRKGEFEDLRI